MEEIKNAEENEYLKYYKRKRKFLMTTPECNARLIKFCNKKNKRIRK
jgi:hypothetical protein